MQNFDCMHIKFIMKHFELMWYAVKFVVYFLCMEVHHLLKDYYFPH